MNTLNYFLAVHTASHHGSRSHCVHEEVPFNEGHNTIVDILESEKLVRGVEAKKPPMRNECGPLQKANKEAGAIFISMIPRETFQLSRPGGCVQLFARKN